MTRSGRTMRWIACLRESELGCRPRRLRCRFSLQSKVRSLRFSLPLQTLRTLGGTVFSSGSHSAGAGGAFRASRCHGPQHGGGAIRAEGIRFNFFSTIDDARKLISKDRPSLVILEHDKARVDGMANCRAIRQIKDHETPVVMV